MTPADLAGQWRNRAAELERYAAPAAEAFRAAAAELEAALLEAADAELTLAEAARESGYSERRLRELLASGDVPQAGRTGRPRIRRADLPRRASRRAASGYDAQADAASLVRRMA